MLFSIENFYINLNDGWHFTLLLYYIYDSMAFFGVNDLKLLYFFFFVFSRHGWFFFCLFITCFIHNGGNGHFSMWIFWFFSHPVFVTFILCAICHIYKKNNGIIPYATNNVFVQFQNIIPNRQRKIFGAHDLAKSFRFN